MDPSTPIQSANIFKTVGKSTFSKIRQLTQFKGDTLLKREKVLLHKVEKCLYGHELAPPYKRLYNSVTLWSSISVSFQPITTFNLGILTNFNAFLLAVLTNFRFLVPVTS